MKRLWPLLLGLPLLSCWGCAICSSPYDSHFPAYGGTWERDTANIHRVGSDFEEAGHQVDSPTNAGRAVRDNAQADEDLSPPQVPAEDAAANSSPRD